ncbi:MAG: acetoin utilization protein AcuC [Thermoproteota archaeon]
MSCKVGLAYGQELLLYSFPGNHPMNSKRIATFYEKVKNEKILDRKNVVVVKPRLANEEELTLFHSKSYVSFVKEKSIYGEGVLDDEDTPAFKGVFEAASYVVGTTLKLVDMIMENSIDHGFNPMGGLHHAQKNSAAGFCVFNDAAIALLRLKTYYKLNRILYFDIDAHHSDGIYYPFEEDGWLYYVDIHEDGRYLYPGTGSKEERGKGEGYGKKINIPLKPKSGNKEFLFALSSVKSFLREAKPEFIVLQAGGDGIEDDPITDLRYSKKAHEETTRLLHNVSHEFSNGRLLILGGGGYNVENTSNAWISILKVLVGES